MELQSSYKVRFNDCDPLGHLNNGRYIDYLLNAREDHLAQYYHISLPQFHRQGLAWVVKTHEIQYLRPAYYNEKVTIVSRLLEVTDTYLLVEMVMYDEKMQSPKAVLWTNFTCVDPQTGKRKNHTTEFMELVKTMDVHPEDAMGGLAERVRTLQTLAKANAA